MIRPILAFSLTLLSGAAFANQDAALLRACVDEHKDAAKCSCALTEIRKGLSPQDYGTFAALSVKAAEYKDDPNAMVQYMMSGAIDMADMGRLASVMTDVGMKAAKTCKMEVVMPASPFSPQ